jgi:hypothetical protein
MSATQIAATDAYMDYIRRYEPTKAGEMSRSQIAAMVAGDLSQSACEAILFGLPIDGSGRETARKIRAYAARKSARSSAWSDVLDFATEVVNS